MNGSQPPAQPSPTESAGKLAALKDLNWPTLILILFSGGTNFFAQQKNSAEQEHRINRALGQIEDLHDSLEQFEKRQVTMLDSQKTILEGNTSILKEVHAITVNLERMRHADQMRGAPDNP
jgi:hypothetical protein